MFVVYLLPQGGNNRSFQIPCKLAGLVPGREDEINKYLPYCKYKATNAGSLDEANFSMRSSVGRVPAPFTSPPPAGGETCEDPAEAEGFKLIKNVLKYF